MRPGVSFSQSRVTKGHMFQVYKCVHGRYDLVSQLADDWLLSSRYYENKAQFFYCLSRCFSHELRVSACRGLLPNGAARSMISMGRQSPMAAREFKSFLPAIDAGQSLACLDGRYPR
jgi:hypothetical protein